MNTNFLFYPLGKLCDIYKKIWTQFDGQINHAIYLVTNNLTLGLVNKLSEK